MINIYNVYEWQHIKEKLNSKRLELKEHEDFNPCKGNIITDMPTGSGGDGDDFSMWYVEEKERILEEIAELETELATVRSELDSFIDSLPQPEQSIVRYKAINNLSFEKIGRSMGYSRKTVSNKFYEILKNTENTEITVE